MDGEMLPPLPASSPGDETTAERTPSSTASSKNPKKRLASVAATENGPKSGDNISVKKPKCNSKESTPKSTPKSTSKSTPKSRQRKAPTKHVLKSVPMGKNFKQCTEQDKMLIEWKESGRTWEDIRKKWREMTGDTTAASTLPNRYSRLKSNFVVIKEEHNALLLEVKQHVEATFEQEKWFLISKGMQEKGANKYKPEELRMQYKNLLKLGVELKADRDHQMQANPSLVKKGKGRARQSAE